MASVKETATFFTHGTARQFEFVLSLYPQALKLKAQEKNKKPEELMKLDAWYQEELPKKIRARGKDAHLTHDELVQCMKWKLTRGQWRPRLQDLVQMNTPRAVETESRRAIKQLQKGHKGIESAIHNLAKLKGVGPATASAVLAAAAPEIAPFMADECLMAIPDIEGIDYTAKEYLKYVQHIRTVVDRLNAECPNQTNPWNPHKVELALWSHYVTRKLEPSLLDDIPGLNDSPKENGNSDKDNGEPITNGSENLVLDGKDSEDSSGPIVAGTEDSSEATNDSLSVVINSEETSREPPTNGNENTNDESATPATPAEVTSNGTAAEEEAAEANHEAEEEPSSKKIRLETEEGAA